LLAQPYSENAKGKAGMHLYKHYIPAFISVICVFFYFTPWLIAANRTFLGLYIISVLWFSFTWIVIIVKIVYITKSIKKKSFDKHRLFSFLLMILCYIILFIGWSNHYIVTV